MEKADWYLIALGVYSMGIIALGIFISQNVKSQEVPKNITLQDIVEKEINNITIQNGSCFNYSKYFYNAFKKYPALDIEADWWICLEKNSTDCARAHSYVVVGGYGSLCLLNSKSYHCYDFKGGQNG